MYSRWIVRARGVIAAGLLAGLASACTGYVSGPGRGMGPMGAAGMPRLSAPSRHGIPPVSTTVMSPESRFDTGGGPAAYSCQRRVASEISRDQGQPADVVLGRVALDFSLRQDGSRCRADASSPLVMTPFGPSLAW